MAKPPIPDSVKHPLSLEADYANRYLYGGAASIVGIIGFVAGLAYLLLGNVATGGILAALGGILFLAGFAVARWGR